MPRRRTTRHNLVLALMIIASSLSVGAFGPGSVLADENARSPQLQVAAPLLPEANLAFIATPLIAGRGSWISRNVAVTDLGHSGTREVLIYTPPVADPSSLPVVYFLHGTPGTDSDLCNAAASNALLSSFRKGSPPFILACPDGNPTSRGDSEWADSVDGHTKLETFVTTELIESVEGAHTRSRGTRALAGFSMGGFGAASIALRHPELYGQVATLAGYFHLDDPDGVFGASHNIQAAHDPTALLSNAAELRWSLTEAADDNLALTAHDSERYASLLKSRAAKVQLLVEPGGHAPAWAVSQLPRLAEFFSAGWTTA